MKSIFQRTNYFILLASGAMLIGFAPIFVKLSMLSSSAISFYRMFLALPFLFLLNYILNKKLLFKVKNKKTIFYTALASLAFTTDLTLWHYSMDITSVSNATIIVNSAPIFVAILSFVVFKERLTKGFLLSFLVTYIGIVGLIYFSNNYNLEVRKQSEDRAHRLGQKGTVVYIDIVARNTLDEAIMKSLTSKGQIAAKTLGEEDLRDWLL